MRTQSTRFSVRLDSEEGRVVDHTSLQSGAVDDDVCLLIRSDVDLEGRLIYLLAAISDHYNVSAFFAGMVDGFGGVRVNLTQLNRFIYTACWSQSQTFN